ncbi:MAG: hypothetical protein QF380_00685 [Candidatus Marinimicrobia bacterium]|nr:hypothetical protein [Candidatus Neomarinimicrobiota bacterium]
MNNRNKDDKSSWLDRVRTNSWESEILIVGFVLIILLQTIGYFEVLKNNQAYLNSYWGGMESVVNSILVPLIINVLFISNFVLVISLSIYLIMRGFWVAVIGLSSVFPKGINVKKLNYSKHYTSKLYKYDIDHYSIIIDKICSSIFSISFLIIMFIISLSFFFSTFILLLLGSDYIFVILNSSLNYKPPGWLLSPFVLMYFFLGIIHFMDFILLGPLKRIKWNWFSRHYSKITKFYSIITLTKFYEILFYTFISRLKKRYIFLFIISLIFLIKFWGNWSFYNYHLFSEYVDTNKLFSFKKYEDKYEKHLQLSNAKFSSNYNMMIQSGVITDSFLELHVPYNPTLNYSIINECDGMKEEEISNNQILKCIDDIYIILLDGINVGELEWVFESHSYIQRIGFFTVIDLSNLKKGKHNLIIHSNPKYSLKDEFNTESGAILTSLKVNIREEIPFYYYPQ